MTTFSPRDNKDVSRLVAQKLEQYLNVERRESRFDTQGYHKTTPQMQTLDLMYQVLETTEMDPPKTSHSSHQKSSEKKTDKSSSKSKKKDGPEKYRTVDTSRDSDQTSSVDSKKGSRKKEKKEKKKKIYPTIVQNSRRVVTNREAERLADNANKIFNDLHSLDKLQVIHRYRPQSSDIPPIVENGRVQNYTRHVGSALHAKQYVEYYMKEGLQTGKREYSKRLQRLASPEKTEERKQSDKESIGGCGQGAIEADWGRQHGRMHEILSCQALSSSAVCHPGGCPCDAVHSDASSSGCSSTTPRSKTNISSVPSYTKVPLPDRPSARGARSKDRGPAATAAGSSAGSQKGSRQELYMVVGPKPCHVSSQERADVGVGEDYSPFQGNKMGAVESDREAAGADLKVDECSDNDLSHGYQTCLPLSPATSDDSIDARAMGNTPLLIEVGGDTEDDSSREEETDTSETDYSGSASTCTDGSMTPKTSSIGQLTFDPQLLHTPRSQRSSRSQNSARSPLALSERARQPPLSTTTTTTTTAATTHMTVPSLQVIIQSDNSSLSARQVKVLHTKQLIRKASTTSSTDQVNYITEGASLGNTTAEDKLNPHTRAGIPGEKPAGTEDERADDDVAEDDGENRAEGNVWGYTGNEDYINTDHGLNQETSASCPPPLSDGTTTNTASKGKGEEEVQKPSEPFIPELTGERLIEQINREQGGEAGVEQTGQEHGEKSGQEVAEDNQQAENDTEQTQPQQEDGDQTQEDGGGNSSDDTITNIEEDHTDRGTQTTPPPQPQSLPCPSTEQCIPEASASALVSSKEAVDQGASVTSASALVSSKEDVDQGATATQNRANELEGLDTERGEDELPNLDTARGNLPEEEVIVKPKPVERGDEGILKERKLPSRASSGRNRFGGNYQMYTEDDRGLENEYFVSDPAAREVYTTSSDTQAEDTMSDMDSTLGSRPSSACSQASQATQASAASRSTAASRNTASSRNKPASDKTTESKRSATCEKTTADETSANNEKQVNSEEKVSSERSASDETLVASENQAANETLASFDDKSASENKSASADNLAASERTTASEKVETTEKLKKKEKKKTRSSSRSSRRSRRSEKELELSKPPTPTKSPRDVRGDMSTEDSEPTTPTGDRASERASYTVQGSLAKKPPTQVSLHPQDPMAPTTSPRIEPSLRMSQEPLLYRYPRAGSAGSSRGNISFLQSSVPGTGYCIAANSSRGEDEGINRSIPHVPVLISNVGVINDQSGYLPKLRTRSGSLISQATSEPGNPVYSSRSIETNYSGKRFSADFSGSVAGNNMGFDINQPLKPGVNTEAAMHSRTSSISSMSAGSKPIIKRPPSVTSQCSERSNTSQKAQRSRPQSSESNKRPPSVTSQCSERSDSNQRAQKNRPQSSESKTSKSSRERADSQRDDSIAVNMMSKGDITQTDIMQDFWNSSSRRASNAEQLPSGLSEHDNNDSLKDAGKPASVCSRTSARSVDHPEQHMQRPLSAQSRTSLHSMDHMDNTQKPPYTQSRTSPCGLDCTEEHTQRPPSAQSRTSQHSAGVLQSSYHGTGSVQDIVERPLSAQSKFSMYGVGFPDKDLKRPASAQSRTSFYGAGSPQRVGSASSDCKHPLLKDALTKPVIDQSRQTESKGRRTSSSSSRSSASRHSSASASSQTPHPGTLPDKRPESVEVVIDINSANSSSPLPSEHPSTPSSSAGSTRKAKQAQKLPTLELATSQTGESYQKIEPNSYPASPASSMGSFDGIQLGANLSFTAQPHSVSGNSQIYEQPRPPSVSSQRSDRERAPSVGSRTSEKQWAPSAGSERSTKERPSSVSSQTSEKRSLTVQDQTGSQRPLSLSTSQPEETRSENRPPSVTSDRPQQERRPSEASQPENEMPPSMTPQSEKERPPSVTSQRSEKERPPSVASQRSEKERPPSVTSQRSEKERPPSVASQRSEKERPPSVTSQRSEKERPPSVTSQISEKERPPSVTSQAEKERPPSVTSQAEKERPPSVASQRSEKERPPSVTSQVEKERPPSVTSQAEKERPPSVTSQRSEKERPPSVASQRSEKERPPSVASQRSEKERPPSVTSQAEKERPPSVTSQVEKERPPSVASQRSEKERPPSVASQAEKERPPSVASQAEKERPPSVTSQAEKERPPSVTSQVEKERPPSVASQRSEKERPPSVASQAEKERPPSVASQAEKERPPSVTSQVEKERPPSVTSQRSEKERPPSVTSQRSEKERPPSVTSQRSEKERPPSVASPHSTQQETERPPSAQQETERPPSVQKELKTPPSAQQETQRPPSAQQETQRPPSAQQEAQRPPSAQQEAQRPPSAQQETERPPSAQQDIDRSADCQETNGSRSAQGEVNKAQSVEQELQRPVSAQHETESPLPSPEQTTTVGIPGSGSVEGKVVATGLQQESIKASPVTKLEALSEAKDRKDTDIHDDTSPRKPADKEDDDLTVFLEEVKFSTSEDGRLLTPKDSTRTDSCRSKISEDLAAVTHASETPESTFVESAEVARSAEGKMISKTPDKAPECNDAPVTHTYESSDSAGNVPAPGPTEVSANLEPALGSTQAQVQATADSNPAEIQAPPSSDNATATASSAEGFDAPEESTETTADHNVSMSPVQIVASPVSTDSSNVHKPTEGTTMSDLTGTTQAASTAQGATADSPGNIAADSPEESTEALSRNTASSENTAMPNPSENTLLTEKTKVSNSTENADAPVS